MCRAVPHRPAAIVELCTYLGGAGVAGTAVCPALPEQGITVSRRHRWPGYVQANMADEWC